LKEKLILVNGKLVAAHIYEYTTQSMVYYLLSIRPIPDALAVSQPSVCVLLDVGTMHGPTSIYHLWKAFDINSNVGSACGEILALKGKYGYYPINFLVAARNILRRRCMVQAKTSSRQICISPRIG